MSNPNPLPLNADALTVVRQMFLSTFNRPLNTSFLHFELDPQASRLIITARDESDLGEVGIYRGSYSWTYQKASLNAIFPHTLPIEASYPLTYRQFKAQMLNRYGVLLEDGDLALTPDGTPLLEGTAIDKPLETTYDQLRLYASSQSGRFQQGTWLSVLFVQPAYRVPLKGLLDADHEDDLKVLLGQ